MNTLISHLPETKQKEIYDLVEIIKEVAIPEKIILFGSHARGDWVEDKYVEYNAIFTYTSDYDFLIIIKNSGRKEHEIISKIVNRTKNFRTPVSPIVHDIDYVNYGLERGQYFFSDIIKEGILLFDANNHELSKPKDISISDQREIAEYYYNEWCESGIRLFRLTRNSFELALKEGFLLNEVIFLLHQTTEKFYSGISLVYTGYKPKTHNFDEFRKYTKYISEELNNIFCFPSNDPEEERLFDILQRSYIDARYKANYTISKEDLMKLLKKIERLSEIVVLLCKKRIHSLQD